eukprot:Filipodium_phascolosomae@DN677_c0_g1_i1.p1
MTSLAGKFAAGESSSFPILCENCLGNNPYVRMTKADYDKECKICTRPCTVFRWRPGSKARFKQTVVCQTCAKLKNVCQTCLFDLEYGLPVQVRDKYLEDQQRITIPHSTANRDYFIANAEQMSNGDVDYGKIPAHPVLSRLARLAPYYKRNEARVCSFFVKGECTRGDMCPYRHEIVEENELSHQNIKDRFHGMNDPVANKLLRRANEDGTKVLPPEDKSLVTLYVGGLDGRISDSDLRDHFYVFGEIKSLRMVPKSNCAFVTFAERKAAEEAISKLHATLVVKGLKLRVLWGKPASTSSGGGNGRGGGDSSNSSSGGGTGGDGGAMPPMLAGPGGGYMPAAALTPVGFAGAPMYYPTMDPAAHGNAPLLLQARSVDRK